MNPRLGDKRWDWQHVVIAVAGMALAGVVIWRGQGHILIQLAAALGGVTGIVALLKGSPLGGGK